MNEPAAGPLAGVRVLDLATIFAGPLTCQMLGDYGADVIKVEHPQAGDGLRGHGRQRDGVGLWFKTVGRNKRSIGVRLGTPQGNDILMQLVADSDVVVESFRPGTLERWDLGYETLAATNPGLVLLRVTGWGQTGPYRHRPGFGTLAEAMSGFAAITGDPDGPPMLPPLGLADGIAGMAGAVAVMLALYHRDAHGGAGQVIDLSILEPIITMMGDAATAYQQLGVVPARSGNRSHNNAPRNVYRTADGKWVAVSSSATSIAERVMRLVGRADLIPNAWFQTGSGRVEHVELLDSAVADWIGQHTRTETLAAFEAANAAAAPIYDVADLLADPHVIAREVFATVDDPELGPVLMQSPVARLSSTPGQIRFSGRPLGADTDDVLINGLGMNDLVVADLRREGIIA